MSEENPFEHLLNSSTPHAPRTSEEIRERLAQGVQNIPSEEVGDPGVLASNDIFDAPTPPEFSMEPPPGRRIAPEEDLADPYRWEADLTDELARAREFMVELQKISATASDPADLVTATVDSALHLVRLAVADRPGLSARMLGPAMTTAITLAQEAVMARKEALQAGVYPEVSTSFSELESAGAYRPSEAVFTGEDHAEPRETRQVLAEALEKWHVVQDLVRQHRERIFTRRIAHDLGVVELKGDLGGLGIRLESTALRGSTAERLAQHVTDALKALRTEITQEEERVMSSIAVGGGTVLSIQRRALGLLSVTDT